MTLLTDTQIKTLVGIPGYKTATVFNGTARVLCTVQPDSIRPQIAAVFQNQPFSLRQTTLSKISAALGL